MGGPGGTYRKVQPGGIGLLSQEIRGWKRGNSLKSHQEKLRLDIRENFSIEKVVQPWEVVGSPSLVG